MSAGAAHWPLSVGHNGGVSNFRDSEAAYNVLYGYEDDAHRSTEMLLFGVGAHQGNLEAWGQWQEPLDQYAKPYYLRAHMDFDFKKRFRGPSDKPQR